MITTADVRDAADILRPVFDATQGQDGRVSIEVDPRLAHNTDGDHRRGQAAGLAGGPPQHAHQDPGDQGGPARDHRGHRQGHQRQRHADLLAGALPRGHGRLPRGPGEGQGRGPRPLQDPLGGVLLRVPRGHRDRQAAGRPGHRRGQGRPRQGRVSPTPGSPTRRTRRSSPPTAGPPSTRRRPTSSARCGPRPASRTRRTRTPCTSTTWSRRTPSTPCRRPRSTPTEDHGEITGNTIAGTYEQSRAELDAVEKLGISYDDVVQLLEDEGVEKFEASWNDLLKSTEAELQRLAPSEG